MSSQAHENGAARHDPTLRTQPQSYQQTDGTPRRPVRQAVEEDEQLLDESYSSLRQAVKPVTVRDLEDALALLKYDMHREMQDIIREQIRQFSIAKVLLACNTFCAFIHKNKLNFDSLCVTGGDG